MTHRGHARFRGTHGVFGVSLDDGADLSLA